jgi:hypothetical protein
MNPGQSTTCAECQRNFVFIRSGGPCPTCQFCCDCCKCSIEDFALMQQEVRSFYSSDFADRVVGDDPFSIAVNYEPASCIDMDLFTKNMVKIAIWPYTMDDDEIVFDPETGRLTDEVAQKVEYYLRLNMAMIPPDGDMPPALKD